MSTLTSVLTCIHHVTWQYMVYMCMHMCMYVTWQYMDAFNMYVTWQYMDAFNQPLSFDTSSVADMRNMLSVRSMRVPCPPSL